MKNTFIVLGIIVLVVIGYLVIISDQSPTDIAYTSEVTTYQADGATFTAQFSEDNEYAQVSLSGMQYELTRTPSASGAKYQNEDGSVVFWNKGNETTLETNGQSIVGTVETSAANENILTFNVAPERAECVGVAPMECLVVNGEFFYDSIAGFEFEPGFEYKLLVKRTERDGVPADASAYSYTLVEEVSKTPVSSELQILQANSWYWKETQYSNDDVVTASEPAKFLLTFMDEGRFSATTDCNNGTGSYTVEDNQLSFAPIATTKKACLSETQEADFFSMIDQVQSYLITEDGDLALQLTLDSGVMLFTPAR